MFCCVCLCIYIYTQLSVAGHLECHILDIMNNAARNLVVVVGHRCTNISVRPAFNSLDINP